MPIQLSKIIPGVLMIYALAIGLFTYQYRVDELNQKIYRDANHSLTQLMTRLQWSLEYLVKAGDIEQVQAEISALGSDPNLKAVLLVNRNGRVIASTKRGDTGERASHVLERINLDYELMRDEVKGRVISEGTGIVSSLKAQQGLVGWYPVTLGLSAGSLRQAPIGYLFIYQDMSLPMLQGHTAVVREVGYYVLLLTAFSLALWLFFHLSLSSRMN
ncbi:MAG: hypothetical protein V3V88_03900, partial [Dehalococcoidia bacterium]